jgi:hypothetical protein
MKSSARATDAVLSIRLQSGGFGRDRSVGMFAWVIALFTWAEAAIVGRTSLPLALTLVIVGAVLFFLGDHFWGRGRLEQELDGALATVSARGIKLSEPPASRFHPRRGAFAVTTPIWRRAIGTLGRPGTTGWKPTVLVAAKRASPVPLQILSMTDPGLSAFFRSVVMPVDRRDLARVSEWALEGGGHFHVIRELVTPEGAGAARLCPNLRGGDLGRGVLCLAPPTDASGTAHWFT